MKSPGNKSRRLSFQELKARVGIDEVAYALGYRLDRKAGVGRFFEMVLSDGTNKKDTLVIHNTPNKAAQTFFRKDGSKGDVVTLVKENLNAFNAWGKDDWQKVRTILAKFAKLPLDEVMEEQNNVRSAQTPQSFQPERYEVREIDLSDIPKLLKQRGFDSRTVRDFQPFVKLVCDKANENYFGFNVAFPYSSATNPLAGYEVRGLGGFKSKATGTDSSTSAWIADFSEGNPGLVRNVYFFESAFDAMAFHQINREKLDRSDVLVSVGGSLSVGQILTVRSKFPKARLNDCFDNDLPGRVNGVRLISMDEGLQMKIQKSEMGLNVEAKGKIFTLELKKPLRVEISEHLYLRKNTGQWTPPDGYKDWNDCLLGKRMTLAPLPNKNDRDEQLAKNRKSRSL